MALKMNVPVRTLQEVLSQHKWDQDRMRDRLQHIVRDGAPAESWSGGDSSRGETIGIIDETSAVKKGTGRPACSGSIAAPSASRRTASCW